MRLFCAALALFLFLFLPPVAVAQSQDVQPGELTLAVSVEARDTRPVKGEMVLITIRGVYRRHITRETLRQPDMEGFSWTQLGPDNWTEERIEGQQVKIFTRRMALFPARPGTLNVGAFTHDLALTDEGDDWFDHQVRSEPISLEVDPAPGTGDWWFPVRRLRITDEWSNAPDQLKPGEAVLRVIRLEALGVTPEMIPPMPELTSPSAMIFPHPEKRFSELTPEGPVTYAFWRWTIRPSNEVSAIIEPISLRYFDTLHRQMREVMVSPQRVAYGDLAPPADVEFVAPAPARLPGWPAALLAGVVLAGGLFQGLRGRRLAGSAPQGRFAFLDPLARHLRRAARAGDALAVRRLAARILARDGPAPNPQRLLTELDRTLFDPRARPADLREFARCFLRSGHRPDPRDDTN